MLREKITSKKRGRGVSDMIHKLLQVSVLFFWNVPSPGNGRYTALSGHFDRLVGWLVVGLFSAA